MAARLHVSDANSTAVRKRIENHTFRNEEGDEYESSKFGGFNDYFRRKKIKLQNLDAELRSSSDGKPAIFRGVVAHVNGYTQPSLNDIHNLIVSYGGGFMQYLDGKTTVTHIIASSLTPKKRVEFRRYRIVKPAWVVESVKAGRLLPWDAFRVIDEGKGQRLLGFDDGKVVNQANEQQRGYRDQTDGSWYTSQVRNLADELSNGGDLSTTQPLTGTQDVEGNDEPGVVRESGRPTSDHAGSPETQSYGSFPEIPLSHEPPSTPSRSKAPQQPIEQTVTDLPTIGSLSLPSELLTVDGSSDDIDELLAQEEAKPVLDSPSPIESLKRSTSSSGIPPAKRTRITAEEHNALLLADPHVRKSSTLNPEFLKQYYSESRLHHLSTWKAALKLQMQQLAEEKSASQRTRQKRPPGARRYILHVDFDSFFASVSLKNAPQYQDKPVAIAHGSGTGSEIASCNYPARKFGVKNGMWMKNAQQLCPELKVLPYDFSAYEAASREFYEAIIATGGIVQSVSVDEALVDITALCLPAGGSNGTGIREGSIYREQAKAEEIARNLRDAIKDKAGCAVSVGIGGNILLAKVALRRAKPAGQYQIKPEEILDFIGDLTVQDLPGVAYSIGGKLEELGVKFVKDVRSLTKERLMSVLGPKTGEKIWDYSRGIDRTEVGEQVVRKSVSAEVNWGVRFETTEQAEEFVCSLCEELHKRLIEQKVKGRQLTMKIMRRAADAPLDPPKHLGHGKCDTFNKSLVLGVSTNSKETLSKEALTIMRGFGFSPGELRGLGVQMTKLEPIKIQSEGQPMESSQKRLHFASKESPRIYKAETTEDPIIDEPETPKKPRPSRESPATGISTLTKRDEEGNLHKPLNTLGTQFVVPSQLDPEVLKALPDAIRSKLLQANAKANTSGAVTPTSDKSRSQSPAISLDDDLIPSYSQLDPDTLSALPEDVRSELLAQSRKHHSSTSTHKPHAQSLLPQSPRKVRAIAGPSRKTTSSSRGKRGGLFARSLRPRTDNSSTTLTQSNFVSNRVPSKTTNSTTPSVCNTEDTPPSSAISPDFLAALPEDIRREVLAQNRLDRLAQQSNLAVSGPSARRSHHPPHQTNDPVPFQAQRRLRLPPRPPKPSFTTRHLTSLPELRTVISAWVREFETEGPYEEDVTALARYLGRVVDVKEEGDLDKARGVVEWLAWCVEDRFRPSRTGDQDQSQAPGKREAGDQWKAALHHIQRTVQDAVRARGLGPLVFASF
ncbi:MAG: deoxycytidyl transferase [Caeruleum heppii]|nr:MAG: deoxycytidyl transferase [Caeruleum heppii]